MRRREVIAAVAGAGLMLPLLARATRAQQTKKNWRVLWVSTESQPDPFLDGFREGLRQRGYVEGQNATIEVRYAPGNPDGLKEMVAAVMREPIDLIVSSGPAIRAMKEVRDVPVLVAISGDPVELGIALSYARPGANFTGSTFLSLEIAGKRVELLKSAIPRMGTLAVVSNVDHPGERSEWRATRQAAEAIGINPIYIPFNGGGEIDKALAAVREARPDAMLVFPEGVTMINRARIAEFAISRKLPSMFGWREYCDAGGLMSYGASQRAAYVRLAAYADRILRGEKPADLPIEQPATFELVINLKTARALEIAIPAALLATVRDVIE